MLSIKNIIKTIKLRLTHRTRMYNEMSKQILDAQEALNLLQTKVNFLEADNNALRKELKVGTDFIREATEVHHDLPYGERDPHRIVLLGKFNGHDYFRMFSVEPSGFKHIVDLVTSMHRRHSTRTLEGPESIRMCIKRGLHEH